MTSDTDPSILVSTLRDREREAASARTEVDALREDLADARAMLGACAHALENYVSGGTAYEEHVTRELIRVVSGLADGGGFEDVEAPAEVGPPEDLRAENARLRSVLEDVAALSAHTECCDVAIKAEARGRAAGHPDSDPWRDEECDCVAGVVREHAREVLGLVKSGDAGGVQ